MAMYCSGCGAELLGGQRFCSRCGRPTADVELNNPPVQGMPPSAIAPKDTPRYGQSGPTDLAGGNTPPAAGAPASFPQYPPGGYWTPPPVYQPAPAQYGFPPQSVPYGPRTNQTATIALILSIVGLVCLGFVLEPVAIFLAVIAKREIAADPLQSGGGMATAALIIGVISGLLHVGLVLLFIVSFVMNVH